MDRDADKRQQCDHFQYRHWASPLCRSAPGRLFFTKKSFPGAGFIPRNGSARGYGSMTTDQCRQHLAAFQRQVWCNTLLTKAQDFGQTQPKRRCRPGKENRSLDKNPGSGYNEHRKGADRQTASSLPKLDQEKLTALSWGTWEAVIFSCVYHRRETQSM